VAVPGVVIVPNLFGMTERQAIAAITSSGLTVGTIGRFDQTDLPGIDITIVDVGQVLIQTPGPGLPVPPGTAVSIGVREQ
jgi:beta-lactam-binding protein with PASTA domain